MEKANSYSMLVGRLLISLIFVVSGLGKLAAYEGTQSYMEMMGIPGFLLPIVILFEVGAGLIIMIGWKARIAALLLAGFSLLTGFIFHFNLGDQTQFIMLLKNIAIAGGFFFIARHGAGEWSVDHWQQRNRQAELTEAGGMD